jgi:hypothetical protein
VPLAQPLDGVSGVVHRGVASGEDGDERIRRLVAGLGW